MEQIQISKKTERAAEWEYAVLLGHDSDDIGFLVKIEQQHWIELTSARMTPELLIKKSFRFLLKKQSKYAIPQSFNLRDIQRRFPEYAKQVMKPQLLWFS
jgi:hypothetical protein